MLNHKGTQEIRTDRLLLRKIKESDYKDIFKYTSKDEVAKYVSWNVHKSIDDTKAVCKMWADEYKNTSQLVLIAITITLFIFTKSKALRYTKMQQTNMVIITK